MNQAGNAPQFYPFNIKKRSGKYYVGSPGYHVGANGALTLNNLIATPFVVGAPQSFSGLCIASLGTAGAFARLGIYTDNGGKPDVLLWDSGAVSISVAKATDFAFGSATVYSGIIWLCYVAQTVPGSVTKYGSGATSAFVNTIPYSQGATMGLSQPSITGPLPASWGSTYNEELANNTAMIFMKTS